MAIVEEKDWGKLHIAKFDDWTISLASNQHVLGWLLLFPPKKIEDSIVHLSDKELLDFKRIGLICEELLKEEFKAEWFNYCQQGNGVRRIHIHLQPRYSSERVFDGHTFTDAGWGRTIRFLKDEELAPKEMVFEIVRALRIALSKKKI